MEHGLGHLVFDPSLGRAIRRDPVELLGVSTQTLFERAVAAGAWDHAAALADYYWAEMDVIAQALYTWIDDLVGHGRGDAERARWPFAPGLTAGVRGFNPGAGDLQRAKEACARRDPTTAVAALETMRLRWSGAHDWLVVWIQELLTSLVGAMGEEAVLDSIRHAYEHIWQPRYARWSRMTPLERLQLSVEGMRGHLSGPRRRGDVGVFEERDRYVMRLDPCGSCGIMRRGDPESGRVAYPVAGNAVPHPWTWGRIGVGWYAVHSPIAMEYLWYERGEPPMRPLEGCDQHGPCTWYVYKDPAATPPGFAERMGFVHRAR